MNPLCLSAWLTVAVSLLAWAPAQAKSTAEASNKTTATRKAKTPKPPVQASPGETRAERDQRLLRECRGKPNAGACEGYAP